VIRAIVKRSRNLRQVLIVEVGQPTGNNGIFQGRRVFALIKRERED